MTLTNERIRFPQVRVIDEQNQQAGVLTSREALDMARDRGLDLICIAPQAQPPVCRIMDYGKFKYEKSKKEKDKKGKSAATELKMVRLHPPTGDHDRAILVRHSERFLREGHKVRVVCQFRRRENAYPELGRQQLDKVADALKDISTVEGQIIKQGRDMTMMLAPKPGLKPLVKAVKGDERQAPYATGADSADAREEAEFEAMQQRIAEESDEDDDTDTEGVDEPQSVEAGESVEAPEGVDAPQADDGSVEAQAAQEAVDADDDATEVDAPAGIANATDADAADAAAASTSNPANNGTTS